MKKTNIKKTPELGSADAKVIAVAIGGRVSLESFKEALKTGGDVSLTGDVMITEPLEISGNVKIDLKGHTISSSAGTALHFKSGNSTLAGGSVKGASGSTANLIMVDSGATLTITGGEYSIGVDETGAANDCIYSAGGTINISGGTFSSDGLFKGHHWVLNVKNGSGGTIKVTGGRFKNFDPSNPQTDDAETYVEEGYESVADYYEVVRSAES